MTWLALAAALSVPSAPTSRPLRLVDRPDLHVGLRPAIYADNEGRNGSLEVGLGATLQVTVFAL